MDTADESFESIVRRETERLLTTADLNTTTERGVVEQLQEILGRPVTPCKHIVKETIERFLDSLGDDDKGGDNGGAGSGGEAEPSSEREHEAPAAKAGSKRGSAAGAAGVKGSKKARSGAGSGSSSEADGGTLWATELGGRKRVSVRRYQGKLFVDVREFYTDKADGAEKPGQKGLSVDAEHWPALAEALPGLVQQQQEQRKSAEADGTLDLGRTRGGVKRASVSEFRGVFYVDLREYYEKDGQALPGKKGISLDATTAQALTAAVPQVAAVLEGRTPPPPAAPAPVAALGGPHRHDPSGGGAAAGAPAASMAAAARAGVGTADAASAQQRAEAPAGAAPSTEAGAGSSAAAAAPAAAAAASWVDLGGSKRLSISRFSGRVFVDLREYYEQAGEFKPGKKGISLDLPTWQTVCQHLDDITAAAQRKDMLYVLEIGNKRRVSLSEFKGTTYVGVREFYEKDGTMLPGAKGLNMTMEQWARCAQGAAAINAQLHKDGLL